MPAAAVIPAPRAYIRVVAVKTCVVEVDGCRMLRTRRLSAGLTAVFPLFTRQRRSLSGVLSLHGVDGG